MLQVLDAIELVQKTKASQEERDLTNFKLYQGFRQGDVYVARIKSFVPSELHRGPQLVEGTSKGSRHVLEGDFKTYEGEVNNLPDWVDKETALTGLFFRVGASGARLTHPEHAHGIFAPNTTWGTWQQMDARTRKRVVD